MIRMNTKNRATASSRIARCPYGVRSDSTAFGIPSVAALHKAPLLRRAPNLASSVSESLILRAPGSNRVDLLSPIAEAKVEMRASQTEGKRRAIFEKLLALGIVSYIDINKPNPKEML